MQMPSQPKKILCQDDVFEIVYDFRTEARARRTKMIRLMRQQQMYPNGRKPQKRIRKYRPAYGYSLYEADKPWDVLVETAEKKRPDEEMYDDSFEISKEL